MSGVPSKLRPFEFDGTGVEDQLFASLTLRQCTTQVRHLMGHFGRTMMKVRPEAPNESFYVVMFYFI